MDMLVNLNALPEMERLPDCRVVRVLPPDRRRVLSFVEKHFSSGWAQECETALSFQPGRCFIAVRDGKLLGFACYDATALGFFGPIGVRPDCQGQGVGKALLLKCLHTMLESGYGYAVIGWCDEKADFYRRVAGAMPIPGSSPKNSVYGRLIHPPED